MEFIQNSEEDSGKILNRFHYMDRILKKIFNGLEQSNNLDHCNTVKQGFFDNMSNKNILNEINIISTNHLSKTNTKVKSISVTLHVRALYVRIENNFNLYSILNRFF